MPERWGDREVLRGGHGDLRKDEGTPLTAGPKLQITDYWLLTYLLTARGDLSTDKKGRRPPLTADSQLQTADGILLATSGGDLSEDASE